jgi:hypothetical protein
MGERTTYGRSHDRNISRDPDFDGFDEEAVTSRAQSYRFGRAPRGGDYPSEESMPMFLSEYEDDEQHEHHMHMHARDELQFEEEHWPPRTRRPSLSSRILLAVIGAASVAVLFALVTSDATRDLIASAKASIIGAAPDPSAPAQPTGTQLTARDLQLNEPVRLPPSSGLPGLTPPVQTASVAPSREDIANAYQSALQTRTAVEATASTSPEPAIPPAPAPGATSPASITAPGAATAIVAPTFVTPAMNAPPPQQQTTRRMDPDELAGIIRRAKSLLASGDIPPARLLLERAADAQEPAAALMLAQTYDAQVLGTKDVRNINADPNTARSWYRRAAQLGSAEAQRRLSQLQN